MARAPIHFRAGKSANILRGAFGLIFRRIACVPDCPGARACELRASCPYARMFEPGAIAPGPSGLADWPRPFVFRATHLDGCTIGPGEVFSFDLNLFDMQSPAAAHLVMAFSQLSHEGLGPGRACADLVEVFQYEEDGEPVARIYDGKSLVLQHGPKPLELSLNPGKERIERVRVRFVTQTELKSGQKIVDRPEFAILAARIRDRLSTLRDLFDDGPLEIDFRGFGERAALVRMVRCKIEHVDVKRHSTRTDQVHPISGFIGEADYEGDLTEFIPYLRAAKWTGVGRQTVWGKGNIEVECL